MPVDPLDALSPGDVPVPPRPAFAAELRARLVAAVHDEPGGVPVSTRPSWLYYCTLPTHDVVRARRFYGELFGWTMEDNPAGVGFHVADVQPPMGVGTNTGGTARVWFTVDDLPRALAGVRAHGGQADDPVDYPSGTSVDCRDDQGTEFSLTVPAYPSEPVPSTHPGELFYFSLPVADGDRARRFFGAVLGWTFDAPGGQGGERVSNVRPDGGLGVGRTGHAPELWFRVADLDEAMATVRSLGGTAEAIGEGPEGRHAACTDDQGAAFGLSQPSPGY